jgi:outer membrane autotransporter protein
MQAKYNLKMPYSILLICFITSFKLIAQNPQTIDQGMLAALNDICPVNGVVAVPLASNLDDYCFFRSVFLIQTGGPAGSTGSALSQNSENYISQQAITNRLEERRKDDFIPKFGLFVTFDKENYDKDPTTYEPGFDSRRKGVVIGLDYKINDKAIVGIAAGKKSIDGDFNSSGGDFETDQNKFILFASIQPRTNMYIDVMAGLTDDDYDITRRIVFIDVDSPSLLFTDDFVQSQSDGKVFEASINAGSDYISGALTYGPQIGLSYTQSKIDAFSEVGATGLELAYRDHKERSLISSIGFHATYAYSTSIGVVLPFASIDYLHEFKKDQKNFDAFFDGDLRENPTPVVFSNDSPDRNYLRFNLGVTVVIANGFSSFVSYRRMSNFQSREVEAFVLGLRKEF